MVLSLPALTQTAALRLRSYPRGFPSIPTRGFFVQLPTMAATSPAAGESVPAANNSDQVEASSSESKPEQKLGNLSANIIPHLFKLYDCTATAADYEIYAPKAVFEDPLMQAHGVKQIKSAFYSIPKIFKEAQIVDYTITEEETVPGSGEIRIDNVQRYKVAGKTINMVSLIKLQVQDGKVVRHEDLWDKNPLKNRETVKVPLMGRALEGIRRGNMMVTHLLMGFGKDHNPKN
ncbi:hypothetical protein CY35_04G122700 [Sphagnum magellanicum]|nr:hypothetical protein CY35_04G122700 [Sphagnum magellanicum]